MISTAILPRELLALLGALLAIAGVSGAHSIYANVSADQSARAELAHRSLWPGELRDRIIPGGHYQPCETDDRGYVTVWCYR